MSTQTASVAQIKTGPIMFTIQRWVKVRDMLLPAIEILEGTHTEEDIVAMLLAGRAGLWIGKDCAAVTEITQWPRFKEVNVFLAGGDMDGLKALKLPLENHARELGCERIVIRGRKGWERVHEDYRFVSIAICKDI